jgi:serine/threonine protein kinase
MPAHEALPRLRIATIRGVTLLLPCGHPASSASLVPTLTLDEDLRPGSDESQPTPRTEGEGRATLLNLTPGTVLLERYRILSILGRGGMGLVYRADDLKLGQPVALKFLAPSLARDPEYRERFLSEVRNARQVAHPNVCRVYDVAEADGHYFLSME